jgi:hypothetical protein
MQAARVPSDERGKTMSSRWLLIPISCLALCLVPREAHAWLFEEHANIGRLASTDLSPEDLRTLEGIWAAILKADPIAVSRMCDNPLRKWTHDRADQSDGQCVDFGALAAVAGDHSCSPPDMWATVSRAPWFPDVYRSAAETEKALSKVGATENSKVDTWHQSNLGLQHFDSNYLTRAANNNVHFVRTKSGEDTAAQFLQSAATVAVPINATQTYAVYHLAALAAAAKLKQLPLGTREYGAQALRVVSMEAFALHFLEDSFSAGHFVGLDPNASSSLPERAGTHDYYCEFGLEAQLWDSADRLSYSAHGDAFQTDPIQDPFTSDLQISAAAVRRSLKQVLNVAGGESLDPSIDPEADALSENDVCSQLYVTRAQALTVSRATAFLAWVLSRTPQPYSAQAPLPHFRNEFGGFFRGSGAARVGAAFGGDYDPAATASVPRLQNALQLGVGGGLGAESLTTHSTDGVFYLQFDAIAYDEERYAIGSCSTCLTAPARFGLGGRIRAPFWVVPGDVVVAFPLLFLARSTYIDMAVRAAEGSVWGRLERVHSGPLSIQIVLGREIGLYVSSAKYLSMKELELPLLEIRTKHVFSSRVGGESLIQLGGALEWDALSTDNEPTRHTFAYSFLARLAFDGIYYFVP